VDVVVVVVVLIVLFREVRLVLTVAALFIFLIQVL
jgi:hypothetical protein